ncbi:MAG: nitrate reductase cytochrome c-type subunit [Gemmataceae bacterium]|nr:nitrate reductase cytochrome c-type subunit [Gemmataceae bacterium]
MRRAHRKDLTAISASRLILQGVAAMAIAGGIAFDVARHRGPEPGGPPQATAMLVRADRRAYDGAPPVIPHKPLGGACVTCHAAIARAVPGVGVAPPNPHLKTPGLSDMSRCQQCHVFQTDTTVFVASKFEPLMQQVVPGERLYPHAPPVIPHHLFMREDCAMCHSSTAGRPEIRCTHPERSNCLQCHATYKTLAATLRAE